MKYLDVIVQTLIILLGLVVVIMSFVLQESDWMFSILYAQLLLGPWQMLSSIVSVIVKAPLYKAKQYHLILSSIYLVVLMIIGISLPMLASIAFLLILPWALAIYYYVLSWKTIFPSTKRNGSFLPNLSF